MYLRAMNRVVHFEIPAEDPGRASNFYKSVFGWEINKWNGSQDYWLIKTGDPKEPGIDGAIYQSSKPSAGESPNAYICNISVPDVDEYVKKIKNAKGQVLKNKVEVPNMGWFASCKDTEGNQFSIMQFLPNPKM